MKMTVPIEEVAGAVKDLPKSLGLLGAIKPSPVIV
jgi:hypothetical protein